MTVNKIKVSKILSKKLAISADKSTQLLETFLSLVKCNSKKKIVKLIGFGSFKYKKTPERVGRNPKTKESYIISSRNKLIFTSSNKLKKILN
tara:strand:- start:207 stop:482 length:276 start_codon:yes stop_codon:yes gene_type:complete